MVYLNKGSKVINLIRIIIFKMDCFVKTIIIDFSDRKYAVNL